MWNRYEVTLLMEGQFGASIPRAQEDIVKMLENRMPGRKPVGAIPIPELAEQIASAVGLKEGEGEAEEPYGWATFERDERGLYYEGRTIRGHLKDCAQQIAGMVDLKNFRSKFVNKVYPETEKVYLGKTEVDGTEQRFIQVMTRAGPRSTIKYVDYVLKPTLSFVILLLDDGVITEEHLKQVFEYGAVHGMGAERSQGWGRYELKSLAKI